MSEYLLPAILVVLAVGLCVGAESGMGRKGRGDLIYYTLTAVAVAFVVVAFFLVWKKL